MQLLLHTLAVMAPEIGVTFCASVAKTVFLVLHTIAFALKEKDDGRVQFATAKESDLESVNHLLWLKLVAQMVADNAPLIRKDHPAPQLSFAN